MIAVRQGRLNERDLHSSLRDYMAYIDLFPAMNGWAIDTMSLTGLHISLQLHAPKIVLIMRIDGDP